MRLTDLPGWHPGGAGAIGPYTKIPTTNEEGILSHVHEAMDEGAISINFEFDGSGWTKVVEVHQPEHVKVWVDLLTPYRGTPMADLIKIDFPVEVDPEFETHY